MKLAMGGGPIIPLLAIPLLPMKPCNVTKERFLVITRDRNNMQDVIFTRLLLENGWR